LGRAYSIGALFYGIGWPILIPGVVQGHEVFHVAVLIGLAFHWEFIYHIADGGPEVRAAQMVGVESLVEWSVVADGANAK